MGGPLEASRTVLMGDSSGSRSKRTLWLIGMMGSGKTSVGRAVAASTRTRFIDLDAEVCDIVGMSIPEFWILHGEPAFRDVEEQVVGRMAGNPAVAAAGGGVVIRPINVKRMRGSGLVIWLRAEPEVLAARLGSGNGRPLLEEAGVEPTLVSLLKERADAYAAAAHHTVDTDGLSVDEVAEEVIGLWRDTR